MTTCERLSIWGNLQCIDREGNREIKLRGLLLIRVGPIRQIRMDHLIQVKSNNHITKSTISSNKVGINKSGKRGKSNIRLISVVHTKNKRKNGESQSTTFNKKLINRKKIGKSSRSKESFLRNNMGRLKGEIIKEIMRNRERNRNLILIIVILNTIDRKGSSNTSKIIHKHRVQPPSC